MTGEIDKLQAHGEEEEDGSNNNNNGSTAMAAGVACMHSNFRQRAGWRPSGVRLGGQARCYR